MLFKDLPLWVRTVDGGGDGGGATGTGATGDQGGASGATKTGDPGADAGDGSEAGKDGKEGRAGGEDALKADLAAERKARQASQSQVDGILAAFKSALGMGDEGEAVTVESLAGKLADWEAKQEAREKAGQQKIIKTEIRAAAKAAGFHDANDALGRVDLDAVEVNEDGEVDLAKIEELVKAVAEKSPYLVSTNNEHDLGSARDAGVGARGAGPAPTTARGRIAAGLAASSSKRK